MYLIQAKKYTLKRMVLMKKAIKIIKANKELLSKNMKIIIRNHITQINNNLMVILMDKNIKIMRNIHKIQIRKICTL